MKVCYAEETEPGRRHRSIGRIRAVARWRGDVVRVTEADRRALVGALIREAESYGADEIVDVRFDVESVQSAEIAALSLRRVAVTGVAVRAAGAG